MGSNREKSNIAIAILQLFWWGTIFLYFGGTNNIFVDCIKWTSCNTTLLQLWTIKEFILVCLTKNTGWKVQIRRLEKKTFSTVIDPWDVRVVHGYPPVVLLVENLILGKVLFIRKEPNHPSLFWFLELVQQPVALEDPHIEHISKIFKGS